MNKCGKCGAQITNNSKYCKACGSSISTTGASLDTKKARVLNRERQWIKPVIISVVVALALTAGWMFSASRKTVAHPVFQPQREGAATLTKAVPVKAARGTIRIPVAGVADGKAHFFSYEGQAKTILFFAIRAADGSIRTAFDACVACNHAKLGYREEGELVVCNNCGMGFKPTDIGIMTGGCSPIAVEKSLDGQMIVLKTKDLETGAMYF